MKKLIILSLSVVLLIISGYFLFKRSIPDLAGKWEVKEIRSEGRKEKIFLKRETRGLNYSCIVLSSNDSSFYNKDEDFWFNAEKVFYKIHKDTLIIMSGSISKKPLNSFYSQFKVKCVQIKENIEYITFLNEYKKYGFKLFPSIQEHSLKK